MSVISFIGKWNLSLNNGLTQLENDLQIYKTITVHRNSFLASILGYQKSYK